MNNQFILGLIIGSSSAVLVAVYLFIYYLENYTVEIEEDEYDEEDPWF